MEVPYFIGTTLLPVKTQHIMSGTVVNEPTRCSLDQNFGPTCPGNENKGHFHVEVDELQGVPVERKQ